MAPTIEEGELPEPSIVIWIDPATQNVKIDFRPQTLQPAEYGVVLSSLVSHVAKLFMDSNPAYSEEEIVAQIRRGLDAGLQQRRPPPAKAH